MSFDEVMHHRGALREYENKLSNARAAKRQHENKKPACEKCQRGLDAGWGRGWYCDWFSTLTERIDRFGGEVDRARAAMKRAETKQEAHT